MSSPNKKCLVTGASRGIGKFIAKKLSKQNYDVIGTARDPEKIPESDRVPGVEYLPLSLGDEGSIDELVAEIGAVDVLINNAGISQIGPIEEGSTKEVEDLFKVNLFGTVHLMRGFLPLMRQRRSGYIINISSLAGRIPLPFSSVYAASKAALESFSSSLRNEVHGYGIKVVVIAPGYVRTSTVQHPCFTEDSPYYSNLKKVKTSRDAKIGSAPSPAVVADKISEVLKHKHPKPYYAVGGKAPFLAFLAKILPKSSVEKLIRNRFKLD